MSRSFKPTAMSSLCRTVSKSRTTPTTRKLITKERLAEIYTNQKDLPVTIRPGYTVRNGEKLDEPFIAEDPDYDMKIYDGEPLKHFTGRLKTTGWQACPITPAQYQAEVRPPDGAAARRLLPDDGRQPQRQQ